MCGRAAASQCVVKDQHVIGIGEIADRVIAKARAEDETVGMSPTGQDIVAIAALYGVQPVATAERVIPGTAVQRIAPDTAIQAVIAGIPVLPVIHETAQQSVIPSTARQGVGAAPQAVGPAKARDLIRVHRAVDHVIGVVSCQRYHEIAPVTACWEARNAARHTGITLVGSSCPPCNGKPCVGRGAECQREHRDITTKLQSEKF